MGESHVFVTGKNLFNDCSPRQNPEQFSRGTMKRDSFLVGIHLKDFALMPFRHDHRKLHGEVSYGEHRIDLRVVGLSRGRLSDGLDGFHQFEHAVTDIGVNLCKAHPHARAKRILVCFRADPGNESLCRQPF